jgi:predicted nucleic acid-binding protein
MHINVFIDTNILLNFFHFTKDELDALSNVFASHSVGNAKVYLTQQVCDEFKRNREAKIKDALKRFNEAKYAAQLPSFTKGYPEHERILKLTQELQQLSKKLHDKVSEDIAAQRLQADALIADIFRRTEIIKTPKEIYERAVNRGRLGNPPGKNDSIGDCVASATSEHVNGLETHLFTSLTSKWV